MLKDKCVISGKQGHEMTVEKSGSLHSIECYTAQVAVTETPKSECRRFPENAKHSTELYLWHQRFGRLASKSIVSIPKDSLKDFRSWISHSSPFLLFALDVYLESLIDDHSVLLLRKLGRYVKKFTWTSKVRWIWCLLKNIFTFWY
jgi:hypothetical protein